MTIVRPRHRSTTFLVDGRNLVYRLRPDIRYIEGLLIVPQATEDNSNLPTNFAWSTGHVTNFLCAYHVYVMSLQPWSNKPAARTFVAYTWTHSEAPACWRHTTSPRRWGPTLLWKQSQGYRRFLWKQRRTPCSLRRVHRHLCLVYRPLCRTQPLRQRGPPSHRYQKWERRLQFWDRSWVPLWHNEEQLRGGPSSRGEDPLDQMTVRLRTTSSIPTRSTVGLDGDTPSHKKSGSAEFMLSLTWPQTCATRGRAQGRSAMPVESAEAERCHLLSASFVTTGSVFGTWQYQPVWPETTQFVRHIRSWSTAPKQTSPTSANTGSVLPATCGFGLGYRPLHCSTARGLPFGKHCFHWLPWNFSASQLLCTRLLGWFPPTCRIGEAVKPGPTICSVNPGGWSLVEPVLNLKHDIVAVQETFVLRDKVNGAKFVADRLGYYSSFTPARKTEGRPSGGLALLCRQAQPLQRMEKGTHWELGRWAHHLLPFEGGLHIFNVYGYSSDKERAQELNREVCLEIFAAVAALGNRQVFILGDWNFEPDDFPIDLVHGGQ
eukprot:4862168-Amphidinium_carterae.2